MRRETQLLVLAKTPVAGRVKTRLCPPLTPFEAAAVAEAALADTLEAVASTRADRRVLVLDGAAGPWLPHGIEVIRQRGRGLDERLAHAFEDAGTPALLIGMDTPQVSASLLEHALASLAQTDAVLGPARDGGYWAIGLKRPDPNVFLGVPMSSSRTLACQRERLAALGLGVADLPTLTDVDTFEDASAVASEARGRRFAAMVESAAAVS